MFSCVLFFFDFVSLSLSRWCSVCYYNIRNASNDPRHREKTQARAKEHSAKLFRDCKTKCERARAILLLWYTYVPCTFLHAKLMIKADEVCIREDVSRFYFNFFFFLYIWVNGESRSTFKNNCKINFLFFEHLILNSILTVQSSQSRGF